MRNIQISVACAVALAFVGVATLKSAEDGRVQGKAIVKTVHGNVQYQSGGGWSELQAEHRFGRRRSYSHRT